MDRSWTEKQKLNFVCLIYLFCRMAEMYIWPCLSTYLFGIMSYTSICCCMWYDTCIFILWSYLCASKLHELILPLLTDLLYKGYNFDQKFSLSTSSSSGLVRCSCFYFSFSFLRKLFELTHFSDNLLFFCHRISQPLVWGSMKTSLVIYGHSIKVVEQLLMS